METIEKDPEIVAISAVYASLKNLDADAQTRVLDYVSRKLKITIAKNDSVFAEREQQMEEQQYSKIDDSIDQSAQKEEDIEGISPVAKKWIIRSGLSAKTLSPIFSLDVDEINLISVSIPGKNIREKMRSVILLKGIASYLGSGAWRFTHEQLKETCLHYDAYDAAHFASYIKQYSSDVTGTKDTGYSLTPRGQSSATEMVKTMVKTPKAN